MTDAARLDLLDAGGTPVGSLTITCLPDGVNWRAIPTLVDHRVDGSQDSASAPVQLLEEIEYQFEIECREPIESLEPQELCSASDASRRHGRLKVGRATGSVQIEVILSQSVTGRCEIEVRSRKLNYESEYRSMLGRIAAEAAELAQSSFAPSSLRGLTPSTEANAETLYQRFAFLQALVESGELDRAFQIIRHRPHLEYRTQTQHVSPGRALRPSSDLARQLLRAGPRQATYRPVAGLESLPSTVEERLHVETFDTIPNRFVRFVVEHWRNLADEIASKLGRTSAADERGRREAERLSEWLARLLATPALAEAGKLTSFPQSNTTIQGRAGYRDILRAFLLGEAAANISWDDGVELFRAGQRDVATLYEYWVFLELVRIVESLPGFTIDRSPLTSLSDDGLTLDLTRSGTVLSGSGSIGGRYVALELCFNRSFAPTRSGTGSWTAPMRPDCSLRLTVPGDEQLPDLRREHDTWLHFDAKYRIHQFVEDFGGIEVEDDEQEHASRPTRTSDRPQAADLTKMHAYRDAIRRSAGAYVLYPGNDEGRTPNHSQFHEILPGLGAFVLRPTENGTTSRESESALRSFLVDVISHVAAQGTDLERSTYWTDRIHAEQLGSPLAYDPVLKAPPADTRALLGFVRSEQHLKWIQSQRRYNLRADGRAGSVELESPALSADHVVLYRMDSDELWIAETTKALFVETAAELAESGYPEPRGERYVSIGLGQVERLEAVQSEHVVQLAQRVDPPGTPLVVRWVDVFEHAANDQIS
jgi:predicted component of viral defense system (DUF524 family)